MDMNWEPPKAIEVEQTVLADMLTTSTDTLDLASDLLDRKCFYKREHVRIFNSLMQIFEEDGDADLIALEQKLKEKNDFDSIGQEYLHDLIRAGTGGANFEYHCRILIEKKMRREGIGEATRFQKELYDGEKDVYDIFDRHIENSNTTVSSQKTDGIIKLSDKISDTLDYLNDIRNEDGIVGVPAGNDLDMYIGGWKPGLHIIGADTSMGKTSLAMDMAMFAALNAPEKYRVPVAIFSLEMSVTNQILRIISSQSGISTSKIMKGKITDEDFDKIVDTAGEIFNSNLYLDLTAGMSYKELRVKAKKLVREHGVGLIIIDYLQLVSGGSKENRQVEVADVARAAKNVGLDLDVPVIGLSQLSRKVENKTNKRPDKYCLRESGELEQAADTITLIYRPEYYGITEYKNYRGDQLDGTAFLILDKHKNGPTAEIELGFDKQTVSFYNKGHSMWPNRKHHAEDKPYF